MEQSKYNLENIIQQYQAGEVFKYVYFWGHQPSASGEITHSCFSQWWQSSFIVDDINYPTAEHYMMAQKALLFNDQLIFEQIINASHPKQVKALGRKISKFDEAVWRKHRFNIVVDGNVAKFGQNEVLKRYLLGTNNRVLVEASPVDKIWGVGLSKDDEQIYDPSTWQGQNLLGFALMEVRDKLQVF